MDYKKKYIIIEEKGAISLSNRVSELMKESYIPFGNLVVVNYGEGIHPPSFCQPMILNEKE